MIYDFIILGKLVKVDNQGSCKSVLIVNHSSINPLIKEISYTSLIQSYKSCISTFKIDGYMYLASNDTCISINPLIKEMSYN